MSFDPRKAVLRGPDHFERFRVPDSAARLADLRLPPGEMLLVVERGGERRALLVSQMAYHHAAQGRLAGRPYLVSF
ncbi:MAG: hypothetical protein ACE5JH_01705 [Acidobacteriota bacterium]